MNLLLSAVILCTNYNYTYSAYCNAPPAIIIQVDNGFVGYLTNGLYWEQKWVSSTTMRFKMQAVDYFISKEGIVYNN